MKSLLTSLGMALLAGPAFAHVGHFGTVAGHDHWIAGVAIGAAVGLAAWGIIKDKLRNSDAESDQDDAEPADSADNAEQPA